MSSPQSLLQYIPRLVAAGVALFVVLLLLYFAYFLIEAWAKRRWPAEIPAEFRFEHEVMSDLKLREIAEMLPARFGEFAASDVACLGVVRGNAARVLFHAGPRNTRRNRNIHRHDYILHVKRRGRRRVLLQLDLNRPYSYWRVRRSEIEPLHQAIVAAYGDIKAL